MSQVTVIIPCYNYGRYLGEAVESVLAQTVAAARVLVVDDGSEDNTPDVARSYGPRIQYIRTPNRGHAAALNEALRQVTSPYYVCLDADNALHPTYLEKTLAAMVAAPQEIGYAYTQREIFGLASGTSSAPSFDLARLKFRNYIDSCSLVRTELGRRFGYDTRMILDDYDFFLTLAGQGITGLLVDEVLFRYRVHQGSLTHTIAQRYRHLRAARQILRKQGFQFSREERAAIIKEARNRMVLAVMRNRQARRPVAARCLDLVAILRGRASLAEIRTQVRYLLRPAAVHQAGATQSKARG